MPESRLETIEGRPVRVIERTPPLPPTLELLLEGGSDTRGRRWTALRVAARTPLLLGGSSAACRTDDHRLAAWLDGFYVGPDGIARTLSLQACRDCGAICVRDRSFDVLPVVRPGRLPPRRRDHILGWYTGSRPRQRTYS